jgi:hypothetical protein
MSWSLVIFALVAVSAQAERVLDLTPKSGSEAGQLTIRERVDCRGRGTGRIGPAPSLSLTIVGLDSREYSMGGQFVVDIRVKNCGQGAHRAAFRLLAGLRWWIQFATLCG